MQEPADLLKPERAEGFGVGSLQKDHHRYLEGAAQLERVVEVHASHSPFDRADGVHRPPAPLGEVGLPPASAASLSANSSREVVGELGHSPKHRVDTPVA